MKGNTDPKREKVKISKKKKNYSPPKFIFKSTAIDEISSFSKQHFSECHDFNMRGYTLKIGLYKKLAWVKAKQTQLGQQSNIHLK